MFDAVVLGIDPGVSRCGYGAVRPCENGFEAVSYGVIRTSPQDTLPNRLAELEAELEHLVQELHPAAIAVERVLFQSNQRTAMSVGQASGLALAVAARAGLQVTHYSPNEVKASITGYGAADKPQVQHMVTQLLNLAEIPQPPDAADALALALCLAWESPLRTAISSDGAKQTNATNRYEAAVAAALAKEHA